MTLARAADRTSRIELGSGVLIRACVTSWSPRRRRDPRDLARPRERRHRLRLHRPLHGQRPNSWAFVASTRGSSARCSRGDRGSRRRRDPAAAWPGQAGRRSGCRSVRRPRPKAHAWRASSARHSLVTPTGGFAWSALMIHGPCSRPASLRLAARDGAAAPVRRSPCIARMSSGRRRRARQASGGQACGSDRAIPSGSATAHARGHLTFLNVLDRPSSRDMIKAFTFTARRPRFAPVWRAGRQGVTEIAFQRRPGHRARARAFAAMAGFPRARPVRVSR